MKKTLLWWTVSAAFIFPAHAADIDEFVLKTKFIEATTRFIDWPETAGKDTAEFSDTTTPFILGVVGYSEIVPVMNEFFQKIKIKHKRVIVQIVSEEADIHKCNLLFIP
jgi:hypothetical protein